MNPLGQCRKTSYDGERGCSGWYYTRGNEVVCDRCGASDPTHPYALELAQLAAAQQAAAPAAVVLPAQDFPASWLDRILALERQVKLLTEQLGRPERVAVEDGRRRK